MITYDNIYELITNMPKFMIPYKYFDICWYIKLKNNKSYENITPKIVTKNLKLQFGNFNNSNYKYYLKFNEFEKFIKNYENYKCLRNGKVIYNNVYIPNNMIQCDNCGRIWDGNAQCNCYLYNSEFGEYSCDHISFLY